MLPTIRLNLNRGLPDSHWKIMDVVWAFPADPVLRLRLEAEGGSIREIYAQMDPYTGAVDYGGPMPEGLFLKRATTTVRELRTTFAIYKQALESI